MYRTTAVALTALAALATAPLGRAAMPAHPAPLYVEGKVIVKYRAGVATPLVAAKRSMGLRATASHLGGRLETLQLPAMTTVAQMLPALRADPAIEYAEPDFVRVGRAVVVPNDTYFGDQWGLYSTGQANFASSDPALASIPGADMDMLAAWDPAGDGSFTRTGDGSATVAIIDDSVFTTQEDLAANIVAGHDFVNNDDDPNPGPGEGHGTFVAGCIGAVGNNGKGVAGVAWNVKLMPLKFAFDVDSFLQAMNFASNHGANIVNASFGGPEFSQAEIDGIQALADADILFVAAAGNADSNTDIAELNYPANYPLDNIVAVAATNRQDNIASFSQFGARTTDVAAPGLQIVTTANGISQYTTNPGVSGTSFSSPYTAGIAALLKMQYPSATFGELKARLIEGAEPGSNANHRTAGGRVNAAHSLDLAPRPALVLSNWQWVDSNGVLDPGEATQVDVTLTNLWQDATTVAATLSADNGLAVSNGSVSFGDIAGHASVTRRFDVTVPSGITDHRYVDLTLAVSADNGYSAERHYLDEIGDVPNDVVLTQAFVASTTSLYDDFHAWHFNFTGLPAGDNQLVIETTAPDDIDLLVKQDAPPQYNIEVGINPEVQFGFFCTSGTTSNCQDPDVFLSAGASGNETVAIDDPTPGTYHIVVVNFAQRAQGMNYTLHAFTRVKPPPLASGGGGGGGALGGALLIPLALLAALRRRSRGA